MEKMKYDFYVYCPIFRMHDQQWVDLDKMSGSWYIKKTCM